MLKKKHNCFNLYDVINCKNKAISINKLIRSERLKVCHFGDVVSSESLDTIMRKEKQV